MILLDTHIWLWWILEHESLSVQERVELDSLALQKRLHISSISIWEIEILDRKEKMNFSPNFEQWVGKVLEIDTVNILPILPDVILAQRKLPDSFHGDPADRLISATSLVTGYPLATKDQKIIDSGACKIWIV